MNKLKLLLATLCVAGAMGVQNTSAQEAGTYYIQNVGTGKWLGPGNNWGTQASVLNHADYWKAAKISDGVYTLESVVSNGGTSYYLTGSYCDGGATNFTLTAIAGKENVYSIANESGGYLTTNGTTVDVSAVDGSAEVSQWKLWSESDMAAGMAAATVENPFDATYLIKDHDLGRNNRYYSAWSNTGATEPKSSLSNNGAAVFSVEAYHKAFDVNQTLSNVPNGVYALRVNGFGRNDSGGDAPYLYANSAQETLPDRTGSENNMQDAAVSFEAGNYLSNPVYVKVTDGTLKVGVATKGTGYWVIFKNFHLQYYGDYTVAEVMLADFVKAYNDALTKAQGYEDKLVSSEWTKLNAIISANTINLEGNVTEEQLTTATANLNAGIAAADVAIANYAQVKSYLDKVDALDAAGQAAFNADATAAAVKSAYEGGSLETLTAEQITALDAALVTAALSQTSEGADMTLGLVNPSFENGFTGWTNGDMVTQSNTSFGKNGNTYVEYWQPNGTKSVTQTVKMLRSGVYTISANTKARGVTSAKLFAAGIDKACVIEDAEHVVTVQFAADANQEVTFGFEGVGTGAGSSWICVDNFQLTYVGALPDVTAVEGKMNADVAAAQTSAIATYNGSKTVTNYNAAQAAIAAAENSVAAYAAAATAIADAKALKEAHNFASATATTTFAEAIAAIEGTYTDGTLTDANATAAATTLGVAATGWHAGTNGAAVKYMNDGFSLNDFATALYVNTWSTEGETDGSGFKVPFYEYWTANTNSLAKNTWTGTLTDLPNGLYNVTVLVRVRAKDGVAAADATGITVDVNGGQAVDATEGTQIGESQFQLATYEAEGLVKNGNLIFNLDIAEDNNISWLSFKNVKYTKVRDLTPEEAAVLPTAIALMSGEDVVTEVALNKTTNTVTLTPSYQPANASKGYIEWSTSDDNVATVANGVVIGVASGTATITATSTLDNTVSANVAVTVSYPETTYETSGYANNGATRTVYTLGENLIKNGSFEYPNAYYGWTYGTGSTTAIASDKFDIVTDGAADGDQYLKAKTNEGGAAAGSLNTSWPIVPGKTYVFGYKVKSTQAAATGNQYLGASLNTTKGQENTNTKFANPVYAANEWTDVKYTFESGENTWLVFNARWLGSNISFDSFYLAEAEYTLEGNVDYVTAAIPEANIGTGAFQYSQDAIDAANALKQGTATVEDVQNAYNALTTINEPADGQLFNVILTYGGWTYDQKAMTYIANGRTDGGLYNIQYKEAANQNLAQAFTFTKVSGNNYKMSQIDADGVARYISTGVPYSGNTAQIRTTTDADKALVVTVIPTAAEGKWNLRNTEANQYIGSQDAGVYTVNSHIDFNIVETTKPSIAINTTTAGWGTVILPFAVAALPDGVKAYTCAAADGQTLTLVPVNALEANKPYIIEGAWEANLTGDAQGTDLSYTEGLLTGVYAQQTVPAGKYVLQNNAKVGFYQVAEGENMQPTIKANRAYLTAPANNARVAFFFDDETTGINAINALIGGNAEIFDANGRAQQRLVKGMNIIRTKDGKVQKVMVK